MWLSFLYDIHNAPNIGVAFGCWFVWVRLPTKGATVNEKTNYNYLPSWQRFAYQRWPIPITGIRTAGTIPITPTTMVRLARLLVLASLSSP